MSLRSGPFSPSGLGDHHGAGGFGGHGSLFGGGDAIDRFQRDKSDPSVIVFSEIKRCQLPHSTQFSLKAIYRGEGAGWWRGGQYCSQKSSFAEERSNIFFLVENGPSAEDRLD